MRRDFPCPGDGGARYPQRRSGLSILAGYRAAARRRPDRVLRRRSGDGVSAPKVGDRVRVTYEGIYDRVLPSGTHDIRSGGRFVVAPPDAKFEILRPPVKVGDGIDTAEQLDALPLGAVVYCNRRCAAERYAGGWYETAEETGTFSSELIPATVLYLPDGAA